MKKLNSFFIFLFNVLFFSTVSFAQSSSDDARANVSSGNKFPFTPRIYFNSGFPDGSNNMGYSINKTANSETRTAVNGSYGSGNYFGGGIGYPICKHANISLDATFFTGKKYLLENHYSTTSFETYEASVNGFYLRPSLMILSDPIKCITPFAEFGINLPLSSMMKTTLVTNFPFNGEEHVYKSTIIPWFKPGLIVGVGANWKFKDNWGVFGEVQAIAQTFQFKHSELKYFTVNGVDMLSTWSTSERETDYLKSYSSGAAPDPTKPSVESAVSYSQSSFNLSIGFSYNFGRCQLKPKANAAPSEASIPSCKCSAMAIVNTLAGIPKSEINLERNFVSATNNYTFKIDVSADVEMKCTTSASEEPCEGIFITEVNAGGNTTGIRKILSERCGATNIYKVSSSSFYGNASSIAELNKLNTEVKVTFIVFCSGRMKRITESMEIMSGELVNSRWGVWEEVNDDESKSIQKNYEKSVTEYLRK